MRACLLLVAGLMLAPSTLAARTLFGSQLADPVWQVIPAEDAGKELTARRGDLVSRAKLVPGGIVTLEEEAAASDTQRLSVPAAAQLIKYRVNEQDAYCFIALNKVGNGTNPCFLDVDGDSRFESGFRIATLSSTGQFGAAAVRSEPATIRPVRYRPTPPSEIAAAYYVGIRLAAGPSLEVAYGGDDPSIRIRDRLHAGKGPYPRPIEILGARYIVLGVDDGLVRLRVDAPIPAQPFRLSNGVM